MFCLINKIRDSWRKKITASLSGRSGQVAVILIVVIAIGLVFFAASINLTLVSQSKTLTMKAASMSASNTASFIASYGQKQYVETMGRRLRYCKSYGGGFMSLLTIIVLIVIIIVSIFYPPALGALQAFASEIAIAASVSLAMEVGSLVVAASIDPGISKAWNKMQNANLSMTGQVMERGVQTALQAAVTDQVKLPDVYDLDSDGLFGYEDPEKTIPKDTISRFAYINTKRYLDLSASDKGAIEAFLKEMHELVLGGADNWGLWDPVFYPDNTTHATAGSHPCYDSNPPAECDYCCDNYQGPHPDPEDSTKTITDVPEECEAIRPTCANRSPFRGTIAYPYIFDFSYENSLNNFMSLREQLGRDDEHHLYHANKDQSNWHLAYQENYSDPGAIPVDQKFHLKDTVGYYTAPFFSLATPDGWASPPATTPNTPAPKLFPFLYKMKDWGPKLSDVTYDKYECHWCDTAGGACTPASDMAEYPEISGPAYRMTLPFSPATVVNNTAQGWCVNKSNKGGANDPPVVPDLVGGLSTDVYVANNVCAINSDPSPVYDLNQYTGGWKRGADRYCSHADGALYSMDCPKHGIASAPALPGTPNPQCGDTEDTFNEKTGETTGGVIAASADQWQDDMLDEIIYGGMPEFFELERSLSKIRGTSAGLMQLATIFPEWYGIPSVGEETTDGISDWIEPPCPDPDSCTGSYTKLPRPGMLWIWRAQFEWLNTKIQNWILTLNPSPSLVGPNAAWCVPAGADGIHVSPPGELATFDVNANGRGDVADVIACLNWNANNLRTYAGSVPAAIGNAQKFQRCHAYCSADTCKDLPRSLVPHFYDEAFSGKRASEFQEDTVNLNLFNTCLLSSDITSCTTNCKQPPLPSGAPYSLPAFVNPDNVKINAIDTKCATESTFSGTGFCNPGTTVLNCAVAASRNACKCSWAGSCSGFVPWGCSDKTYYNNVTDALNSAQASCADGNYKQVMLDSAKEAQIQVEKFKHRLQFLKGRYDEAMALSNDQLKPGMDPAKPDGILTVAIQKLTAFLDAGTPFDASHPADAPAEKLIDARQKYMTSDSGDLPAFAIYVWQDEDPGGLHWDSPHGYWHAVKVEARIPRRCTGDCIASEWPKIFSKTKKARFFKKGKVCYTLINLVGRTKARVIRYDQDKDLRGLLFPGKTQIWDSRLSHPKTGTPDPAGLRKTCEKFIDPDLNDWLHLPETDDRNHLGAAFMLNKNPVSAADSEYTKCWEVVHKNLLAHGIQSEACAEYYFAGIEGFRVKFVPCDRW